MLMVVTDVSMVSAAVIFRVQRGVTVRFAFISGSLIVNPCSDQSSTGGVDDLNSLLCVQRGPNSKSYWNEIKILTTVIEEELLAYTCTSDVACMRNEYSCWQVVRSIVLMNVIKYPTYILQ